MGVSIKDNDEAIGRFGTGLKYAIAGILRTGGKIEIRSGTKSYEFGTVEKTIRGKTFNIVSCNGEELSYCTDYGHHWKAWQWFRELQSNALDEGGDSTDENDIVADTVIVVNHPEIAECWDNRDKFFLDLDRADIIETINGDQLMSANGMGKIYCKGVFVGDCNLPIDVNFRHVSLTEDRTIQYTEQHLAKLLVQSTNNQIIRMALNSDYPNYHAVWATNTVSNEFLDAVHDRMVNCKNVPSGVKGIYVARRGEIQRESFEPTAFQLAKLRKATEFLANCGEKITEKINFVKTREDDTLYGFAKNGEIFLTEKAFSHGVHDLVQTVLEEHYHCTTGHADLTRDFQQFLFRKLVEMMEIASNDPL